MTIAKREVRFAVSSTVLPKEEIDISIAASITVPKAILSDPPAIFVCWPGGSYGRNYWDLQIPGRSDFSFADHMASRGYVVIAADPLGVGDSARPADGSACTLPKLAEAAADDVVRPAGERGRPRVGPDGRSLSFGLRACGQIKIR